MNEEGLFQEIVNACGRYGTVPREEWAALRTLVRFRSLARGDCFIRAGELPRELAFILRGGVKHWFLDANGSERITDFCLAGGFTGSLELYAAVERPAAQGIEAFTETHLAVIGKKELEGFLADRPVFQELFRKILMDYYRIKSEREMQLLCPNLAERYENFLRTYPELPNELPQYQIAAYLGMTPETLSRIRSRRGGKS